MLLFALCQHELQTTRAVHDLSRGQTGAAARGIGPDIQRFATHFFCKQSPLGVVHIHDSSPQASPCKKRGFGVPIGIHAAVVIQVVLGEVGEQGHINVGTGQAVF